MTDATDDSKKTATITIAVSPEFKEEIKAVAKAKRWSVSQTLGILIETYWEDWVSDELNIDSVKTPQKAKK